MDKKEIEVHLMLAHSEDRESGVAGEVMKLVENYIKENI